MLFAYLPQQFEKLGQALADDFGVTADAHKIRVPVPSRDNMQMKMSRQPRTAASAEIHTYIEAVGLDGQRQGLLRFPDELGQFQQLGVGCLFETGNMTDRCNQYVAVVIGKAIQYDDAFVCSPEYEVFAVLLRVIMIIADKTFIFFGDLVAVFIGLGFLVQTLDIFNSPWCPQVISFHNFSFASRLFLSEFNLREDSL
jgi:hypothetical protein